MGTSATLMPCARSEPLTAVRKARSTTRRSIQNCDGVNCCEIDVTSCCAKRRNDSSYASPKVWYRAVILSFLSWYWKEMDRLSARPSFVLVCRMPWLAFFELENSTCNQILNYLEVT